MNNLIPEITDISQINEDECIQGYMDGLDNVANHMQKSASYWHGYRNARVDRGCEPASEGQIEIARQYVEKCRREGVKIEL